MNQEFQTSITFKIWLSLLSSINPLNYIFLLFRRDEVNHLMNQQNDLVKSVRELQASIADVQRKANFLNDQATLKSNNNNPPPSLASANVETTMALQKINENLSALKYEMGNQATKVNRSIHYLKEVDSHLPDRNLISNWELALKFMTKTIWWQNRSYEYLKCELKS